MTDKIEARKNGWNSLMDGQRRFVYIIGTPWEHTDNPIPPLWPEYKKERIDWAVKGYEQMVKTAEWLDDDQIPFLNMVSGTEIFAEAIGCPVYRPEDNMPFAIALVKNAKEAAELKIPRLADSSLMVLLEMAETMRKRTCKDAVLKLPDIQSPMDILAQVWDKTDLFMALYDEPETVKEVCKRITELLTEFLDEWFRLFGKEFIAHHPDYYMKKGITLSADEIGSVSLDMYDDFFAPELNGLSERYGAIGIHCCADSEHLWERLAAVKGLKLINLYRTLPVLKRSYKVFDCVHFPGLLIDGTSHELPEQVPSFYPAGTRAVLNLSSKNREDAIAKATLLREECGE